LIPVGRTGSPLLPRPSAPIPPLPGSRPPTARGLSSKGPPRGFTRRARASPGTDHPMARLLPGARSDGRRPSEKTALFRDPRLPPILHLPAGIASPVPVPTPGPLLGPFSQPRSRPRRPGATDLLPPRSPVPRQAAPRAPSPPRRVPPPPLPPEAVPAAASERKISTFYLCPTRNIAKERDLGPLFRYMSLLLLFSVV